MHVRKKARVRIACGINTPYGEPVREETADEERRYRSRREDGNATERFRQPQLDIPKREVRRDEGHH